MDESLQVKLARMEERQLSMSESMDDKFDSLEKTLASYHSNVDSRITGLAVKVSNQEKKSVDHETRIGRGETYRKITIAIVSLLVTSAVMIAAAYIGRDKQIISESDAATSSISKSPDGPPKTH